jgi:hypothetical protein
MLAIIFCSVPKRFENIVLDHPHILREYYHHGIDLMPQIPIPRSSGHGEPLSTLSSLTNCISIAEMDMLSSYLYQLFNAKISHVGDGGTMAAAAVFPPNGLSLQATIECEQLSTILAKAYLTPSARIIAILRRVNCLLIHPQFSCHGAPLSIVIIYRPVHPAFRYARKTIWKRSFRPCMLGHSLPLTFHAILSIAMDSSCTGTCRIV